jgi:hypothetical protein
MKKIAGLSRMALTLVAFAAVVCVQIAEAGEANVQPTPEIKKLFEAFAGDWDTSENRERTQFFPNGGERKRRSHIRLGGRRRRAGDGRPLRRHSRTAELGHRGLVG